MKFDAIVDRIEGNKVILLPSSSNERVEFPINLLPRQIKEGDVLNMSFAVDHVATERAQREAKEILDKLFSGQ